MTDITEEYAVEALQLGQLERLIAKYTIRDAIEKLLLLNFGRKIKLVDVLSCKERTGDMATEVDLENNTDKLTANLVEICEEIEYYGTFEKLSKFITDSNTHETTESQFLRNYAINKAKVEYLEKKMPSVIKTVANAEKQMRVDERAQDEQNLNALKIVEMETRCMATWESARLDQLNYAISNDQQQNYNECEKFKALLNSEAEAATNLNECYQTKIGFLENSLEYWNGEYERQMENISTDIQLTQEWISELERKIEGQQEEYATYVDEVECFNKKRARIASAKKIQRWWRNILQIKLIDTKNKDKSIETRLPNKTKKSKPKGKNTKKRKS